MPKKILFVTYGGGHINIILPLAKECFQSGFKIDIMGLTGAKPRVKAEGLNCLGYEDFIEDKNKKNILKAGQKLLKENHNPTSGISINESLCYLGVNWLENESRHGEKLTNTLYKKAKRHSFLPINFFKKVLVKGNYDLLVTTNSPKSERASLIAANILNIKSVRIEDLFFDDNLQIEIIEMLGRDYYPCIGKFRTRPSKIFVMCDYTKRIYDQQKEILLLDSNNRDVVVTGQPIIESIYQNSYQSNSNKDEAKSEIILWAHQNNTFDEHEVLDLIKDWLRIYSSSKKILAVKFHPLEQDHIKKKVIDSLFKINSNFLVVDENDTICNWISKSSVLISQGSTAMLEAFFLKKPSIILDPNNHRQNFPYVCTGISKIVSNAHELNEKFELIKFIKEKEYLKVKNSLGFKLNAVKNMMSEIKNLLDPHI